MLTKNHIKLIRSLSLKKNRLKYGLFVVEGEKLVNEVIASDWEIESVYATKDWIGQQAILISDKELSRISSLKTPNKVLALVKIKLLPFSISGDTVIALDGVKDPGNLGTIIRTADWFGVSDIICSTDSVDYLNSKVIQSTMVSFCRVNVHYTDLKNAFNGNKDYSLMFTTLRGKSLKELKGTKKKIIVFGGEANGISQTILELNGENITIDKPKDVETESLNVAIATAIILSHV